MKKPRQIEMTPEEIESLIKRLEKQSLEEDDYEKIKVIMETFIYLGQAVDNKIRSIRKLLGMIFGTKTERLKNVLGKAGDEDEEGHSESSEPAENEKAKDRAKPKKKGHGRNGASSYTGAAITKVSLMDLKPGDICPLCEKGRVYELKEPAVTVRVSGNAPLQAKVFELDRARCNLCGEVFTAAAPEEAQGEKYDETAVAMIALLKYGSGFPFNRLDNLQGSLGIPLPASTQWDIVNYGGNNLSPVFAELTRQGAQGEIIHNDDTTMKILEIMKNKQDSDRTGVFTTGILSVVGDIKIGLFYTGIKHSGENMTDLLGQRHQGLSPPIQMCDALSRNISKEFETILANCMAHGRRNFVDLVLNFPEQCRYVIETLAEVYKNDKTAKEKKMTKEQRLIHHQTHSGPSMNQLNNWLNEQINEKKVEPNSGLGSAIQYMLNHWEPLTRFLTVPGAPLDNNICEQALKKAILHRKNSYFYKTPKGAYIGDLFMSLIHTCNLNRINPFDYLTELLKHFRELSINPQKWMPWNYRAAVDELST